MAGRKGKEKQERDFTIIHPRGTVCREGGMALFFLEFFECENSVL